MKCLIYKLKKNNRESSLGFTVLDSVSCVFSPLLTIIPKTVKRKKLQSTYFALHIGEEAGMATPEVESYRRSPDALGNQNLYFKKEQSVWLNHGLTVVISFVDNQSKISIS